MVVPTPPPKHHSLKGETGAMLVLHYYTVHISGIQRHASSYV